MPTYSRAPAATTASALRAVPQPSSSTRAPLQPRAASATAKVLMATSGLSTAS